MVKRHKIQRFCFWISVGLKTTVLGGAKDEHFSCFLSSCQLGMQDWLFRLGLWCIFSALSLTFDKRKVLPDGAATEVTSCGLTENLFKLMTEVIENSKNLWSCINCRFFLEWLQYVLGQCRFWKLKCLYTLPRKNLLSQIYWGA